MKKLVLALLATLCAVASTARAASTIYTDMPTFFATLRGTSYTETFSNGDGAGTASYSFSLNGFAYTVTTSSGVVYYGGGVIGSNTPDSSTTITFTSGNVFAVGGNFFQGDINSAFVSDTVTLTLNDGTTTTYTPASMSTYRGFTSSTPITSLTFAAAATTYPTIDNLTVGTTVVPEPSTWALLGVGVVGAGFLAHRRRRAAA